ncbi:MAG TPA: hypothetical protein VGE30_00170 [Candidatus Saccharimonadales bacterium]
MASEVANEAVYIPGPRSESCSRFDEFIELARYQRDHVLPQNRDEYTAAYEKAFADTLDTSAEFREFFDYLLRDMQDVEPENVLRRTLKTFQHIEKSNNYMTFPQGYGTPEAWQQPFAEVLQDGDYQDQFFGNIFLPIMSNVSERGILLKAVALLHEKREQVRILDMGCSLNDVLHRLALEQSGPVPELAYNNIDVMRREPLRGSKPQLDTETTQRFNDWLNASPLDIGPSVGIDALPFDEDERLRARALSDSRYMGELVLSHLSAQLYLLARSNPPQVSFRSFDAATFDPDAFGQSFDIAYGSTMLYQTPRETRRDILHNAQAVTESDGLIVYQDFIRRMGTKGGMQFYKRWLPYTYGVWVHDKQRPDLGFQKYFTVYSGRVEKIIPNEAALGRLPVAKALGLVRT